MSSCVQTKKLRADSFGWRGQFFQSMAHIAPAIGLIFTAPFMASRAGAALPLATFFAMILAFLLAYCLGLLTRRYYGASGYFQIHSRALGSTVGFTTSWLFLIYEPINAFATLIGFGALILEPFSEAYLGHRIPWWVGSLVGNGAITLLSLTNVKSSIRVTAFLGAAEFLLFLIFGIVLWAKSNFVFHPLFFMPSHSADGPGGLMFAFIFGFLCFVGFESGLPLTEETKDTHQSTYRGLMISVLLAGIFFTFISYVTVVAFGGGENTVQFAKDFSSAENPYGSTLAIKAFGVIGPWLIFLAAVNSTMGCCLAGHNSATRVFFALGRAQILPSRLGRTHRRSQAPVWASCFASAITFSLTGLFYLIVKKGSIAAVDWYGFFGVLVVVPLLIIHLMTCLSVFVSYKFKEKTQSFEWVRHAVIPLVAGGLTCAPLWGAIYYNQTAPMSYAPYIVLLWFFIGVGVYLWLRKTRRNYLYALEQEIN